MIYRGISELVLVVQDFEACLHFYQKVLDLPLVHAVSPGWAWFWTGIPEQSPMLALRKGSLLFEEGSPYPAGERFGRVHYALEVPLDQQEQLVKKVEAVGVQVYGPVTLDWMKANSYYFYDPEGNLLEFWSPKKEHA